MTECIRTMIVTTNGSRIESIKPLIQPNPAAQKRSASSPETELQGNLQKLIFESVLVYSTERLRTLSGIPRNVLYN